MTSLRLQARTDADLVILSGMVQDSLVMRADMAYLVGDRQFVLAINRFCWESTTVPALRVTAGLVFRGVNGVRSRQLPAQGLLALLAIRWDADAVRLDFSGGGAVALRVDEIDCRVRDLGEPWPTQWRPRHDPT